MLRRSSGTSTNAFHAPRSGAADKQFELFRKDPTHPSLHLKPVGGLFSVPGSFFNVLPFWPKKNFIRIRFRVTDPETWVKRLSEAGVEADLKDGTLVLIRVRNSDFEQHEDLLRELIHQAIKEKAES